MRGTWRRQSKGERRGVDEKRRDGRIDKLRKEGTKGRREVGMGGKKGRKARGKREGEKQS